MKRKVENRTRILPRAWWLLAAIVVGLVIAIRIRLLGIPLERDEGEYAYAGQLMLQGIPPYKLAYNMKFPGTYAAYALMMSIFGQTTVGIHLGLLLVNIAATALIFFLGRRLVGSIAGITAAASYAVLSVNPGVFGLAAHATHFVILPVLGGILLLTSNQIDSSRGAPDQTNQLSVPAIFASGVLFGIGVLMKQPAVFLVLFGAAYLSVGDVRRGVTVKGIVQRNLIFSAGMVLPLGISLFLLWWAGVFGQFWFWTIDYARQYASLIPPAQAGANFAMGLGKVIAGNWTLFLLAATGLGAGLWHKPSRSTAGFLLSLLGFSSLALSAGFYFREHYFILILPVIALLVGLAIARFSVFAAEQTRLLRSLPPLLLFAALSLPIFSARNVLFEASPENASRIVYEGNPFPESIRIADYIREHSTPDDTIAVLGSEPQIYFYTRRHSATGYIYTYSLMEAQRYAHQMQEEMIREIEQAHPKYLVSVELRASWLQRPDSERSIVNWANDYMRKYYDIVGLVAIWQEGADYYLGELPKSRPVTDNYILILQRKSWHDSAAF